MPVRVSPRRVNLNGYEGQVIARPVKVTGTGDMPLEIEPIHFDLAGKVTYEIQVMEPGKSFKITFKNIPGPEGVFRGALKLKTNYSDRPEIDIPVTLKIRKARENRGKTQ